LPLPPAAARARRQPTAAALRAFIANLEQEAREHAPQRAGKTAKPPAPTRWSRRGAKVKR
jgi:hypothetical protein